MTTTHDHIVNLGTVLDCAENFKFPAVS